MSTVLTRGEACGEPGHRRRRARMAERERRDRQVLQHVRDREREREHEERCAEETNEHDGEQQPAGEGERHVDGEPRGGVDEARVRIERIEQRRRLLRRVPAPGVGQLEPAQAVVAPHQARHAGADACERGPPHAPGRAP